MKRKVVRKQREKQSLPNWMILLFIGIGGAAFLGLALFRANTRNGVDLEGLSPEARQLVIGERVYNSSCTACHKPNMAGQDDWKIPFADGSLKAPPLDETGLLVSYTDDEIEQKIRLGANSLNEEMRSLSNMPSYDTILSDDEIDAVIAFIKSRWPDEVRDAQSQISVNEQ